jgi:hypothetical protein
MFVRAQGADNYFGKNRIQRKNYNWQVLSYRNTDIYYTYGNKALAEKAGTFAEENLISLTETIGYTPFSKLRIIIYGNIQDHHEANIAINQPELLNNHKGTFVKNRIEVVFKGSYTEFENDLKEGICAVLLNTMLYGGSFKEIIQSAYFLSLPEWFVRGASHYSAFGWNLEMDDYIRSLINSNKLQKPEEYSGQDATLIGQSIWNYFVLEYGQTEMQMLLNYLKLVKDYKMAFESTTGINYEEFVSQWKAFYTKQSKPQGFSDLSEHSIISKKNEQIISISTISENKIRWVSKKNNRYKLKQNTLNESSKPKTLLKGGSKVINRQQDSKLPITRYSEKGWSGLLTNSNKGYNIQVFYSDQDKKGKKYFIKGLHSISDFSFSPDGRSILIAGSNSTNSDIYQYFFQNNKLIQVTNLSGDELNPTFIPNSSKIVFTSNATKDSISQIPYFQIFTMDLRDKKIEKPFSISGNCYQPIANSEKIYFLNDYSGIQNIYSYKIQDSLIYQESASLYNIIQYDLFDENNLLIKTEKFGQNQISNIAINPVTISPNHIAQTERAKYIRIQLAENSFQTVERKNAAIDKEKPATEKQENIDIYNYRFESENQFGNNESIHGKLKSNIYFNGPNKYNNPFSVEQINSTFLIDPLRGLGLYLDAGMTDVLENHKITIGIFGLTNLKSSNLFGEYQILKYRTDFSFRYDRKTLHAVSNSIVERYALNEFKFTVSYPFDVTKRTGISPFIATTTFNPMDLNYIKTDTSKNTTFYYGSREFFVIDNTEAFGLNSRKGIRGFIYLENFFSNQSYKNFGKLGIDIRYYLPLVKRISLTTRGFYGSFFGKAPKNFLAGGMNNWLFNRTNINGNKDPLRLQAGKDNSDLLFIEYITPLRGFNYNQQFGTKTFVVNAELHVPFVDLLYPREISSIFLKNFELVGFTDIGAAWSGGGLFSNNNTLNTVVKDDPNSPFSAVVNNYKKPYLWGYGFGFRSMLLGYFIKLDIAWGVLDKQVQDPKYYFTLGYDF